MTERSAFGIIIGGMRWRLVTLFAFWSLVPTIFLLFSLKSVSGPYVLDTSSSSSLLAVRIIKFTLRLV